VSKDGKIIFRLNGSLSEQYIDGVPPAERPIIRLEFLLSPACMSDDIEQCQALDPHRPKHREVLTLEVAALAKFWRDSTGSG
jgi:hypothetical protein